MNGKQQSRCYRIVSRARRQYCLGVSARVALTSPAGIGVDETTAGYHWFAQLTTRRTGEFQELPQPLQLEPSQGICGNSDDN